jgi:hypothetical protein
MSVKSSRRRVQTALEGLRSGGERRARASKSNPMEKK